MSALRRVQGHDWPGREAPAGLRRRAHRTYALGPNIRGAAADVGPGRRVALEPGSSSGSSIWFGSVDALAFGGHLDVTTLESETLRLTWRLEDDVCELEVDVCFGRGSIASHRDRVKERLTLCGDICCIVGSARSQDRASLSCGWLGAWMIRRATVAKPVPASAPASTSGAGSHRFTRRTGGRHRRSRGAAPDEIQSAGPAAGLSVSSRP